MSVVGVAGVGEKGACSGRRGFDGVVFCGGAGLGARDAAVSVVLVGVDATGVGEKGAWCTGRSGLHGVGFYNSVGLGAQDAAAAGAVVHLARAEGR